MENIILLTKENCPQCKSLKLMLNNNPKTKAVLEQITRVHETENPEEYKKLITKYGILSMPALIKDDKVVPLAQIPMTLMSVK